jgi:hypothetical protein
MCWRTVTWHFPYVPLSLSELELQRPGLTGIWCPRDHKSIAESENAHRMQTGFPALRSHCRCACPSPGATNSSGPWNVVAPASRNPFCVRLHFNTFPQVFPQQIATSSGCTAFLYDAHSRNCNRDVAGLGWANLVLQTAALFVGTSALRIAPQTTTWCNEYCHRPPHTDYTERSESARSCGTEPSRCAWAMMDSTRGPPSFWRAS